jgi:hypothetical protein
MNALPLGEAFTFQGSDIFGFLDLKSSELRIGDSLSVVTSSQKNSMNTLFFGSLINCNSYAGVAFRLSWNGVRKYIRCW